MTTGEPHPRCPHCDYDLHRLRGSTCPECGATVDLESLLNPDFAPIVPYTSRLVFMTFGLLLAVPVGLALMAVVGRLWESGGFWEAMLTIPASISVAFLALAWWPPSLILIIAAVAIAVPLFVAASTPRHRWYLALIGVLLVDAAWVVSIWCGVQDIMNA